MFGHKIEIGCCMAATGSPRGATGLPRSLKMPLPQEPTVALCLGTYGDSRGVGVSYERGTPVVRLQSQRMGGVVIGKIKVTRESTNIIV